MNVGVYARSASASPLSVSLDWTRIMLWLRSLLSPDSGTGDPTPRAPTWPSEATGFTCASNMVAVDMFPPHMDNATRIPQTASRMTQLCQDPHDEMQQLEEIDCYLEESLKLLIQTGRTGDDAKSTCTATEETTSTIWLHVVHVDKLAGAAAAPQGDALG